MKAALETDVCIVGSGVAGALIASELCSRTDLHVLILEAGPSFPMRKRRPWLDHMMGYSNPYHDVSLAPDEFDNRGPLYFPGNSLVRARGGSTLAWSGWSLRLMPEDFTKHARTGKDVDWPISYNDLEPYYQVAERTLRVAGDATDPGHPPRSGEFPLPGIEFIPRDMRFIRAMKELGHSVQHCPIARNTIPSAGLPACLGYGTCAYCPIGAKFSADQLLDALDPKRCRILTRHPARHLLLDDKGNVLGATAFDASNQATVDIHAQTTIVCAGGIYSPTLLLASTSSRWPDGVGNRGGMVGRFLMNHLQFVTAGRADAAQGEVDTLPNLQTVISRAFDTPDQQREGKFILFPWLLSSMYQDPFKDPISELVGLGRSSAEIRRELREESLCALVAQMEQQPDPRNRVEVMPGWDRQGTPRARIAYGAFDVDQGIASAHRSMAAVLKSMDCDKITDLPVGPYAHHMGTCRMSSSPDTGVVDSDLRVHGTENLYVCGSATFPTGGAANPTLTIAALAHRLSDHLIESS